MPNTAPSCTELPQGCLWCSQVATGLEPRASHGSPALDSPGMLAPPRLPTLASCVLFPLSGPAFEEVRGNISFPEVSTAMELLFVPDLK